MLPEMRAELGFRLRNPPTEGRVSEKTRCTADSQVLSGAVTLWTLRNPNLSDRQTNRRTNTQTDRQADRQTGRQAGRQAGYRAAGRRQQAAGRHALAVVVVDRPVEGQTLTLRRGPEGVFCATRVAARKLDLRVRHQHSGMVCGLKRPVVVVDRPV